MAGRSLIRNLDDRFDFDGDPERQTSNSDRRSSVLGAEDLLEQIGAPIDHSGVLAKVWYGIAGSAARITGSSGCEAPVRKVKLLRQWSSA